MFRETQTLTSPVTAIPTSPRHGQLLDALETLVRREGLVGMGVGEIASRLNCSRSTLYAIAPSKEQLFVLLVGRLLDRIQTGALALADRKRSPKGRLEAYLSGAIEEVRGIGLPFLAEVQRHEHARKLLEEFRRSTVAQLRSYIEDGIKSGVFHPVNPLLAAELLDAAAARIQDPQVLAKTGLTASEAVTELMRFVTRGLNK